MYNDSELMKDKWNDRYSSDEYFFGKEPNEFLKSEIDNIPPGKALFIGEGEGRNSVYAATLGWNVDAIDVSDQGKVKAQLLAKDNNVSINYIIDDAVNYDYEKEKYDAIAIIYFHIEKSNRDVFVRNVINSLSNNGKIILLVYEEEHINNGNGGPSDIELLYSLSEVAEDFINLEFNTFEKEFISRTKKERKQKSTVIKFVGTKI